MSFIYSIESSRKTIVWPSPSTAFEIATKDKHPFEVPYFSDKPTSGKPDYRNDIAVSQINNERLNHLAKVDKTSNTVSDGFLKRQNLFNIIIGISVGLAIPAIIAILVWNIIKNDKEIADLKDRVEALEKNNANTGDVTTAASISDVSTGSSNENLALLKTATQSSTWEDAVASRAVDGITDSLSGSNYICATTNNDAGPWWQVDLGNVYKIGRVNITTRTDGSTERLRNVKIEAGLVNGTLSLCGYRSAPFSQTDFYDTFTCPDDLTGQIVKVSMDATDYLQLCEVQVYSS